MQRWGGQGNTGNESETAKRCLDHVTMPERGRGTQAWYQCRTATNPHRTKPKRRVRPDFHFRSTHLQHVLLGEGCAHFAAPAPCRAARVACAPWLFCFLGGFFLVIFFTDKRCIPPRHPCLGFSWSTHRDHRMLMIAGTDTFSPAPPLAARLPLIFS